MQQGRGLLFVVSAPSGTGKTSLCAKALEEILDLVRSISYTTRPRRPNERNGVDYHFVNFQEFEVKIEKGELIEWVELRGYRYGTGKKALEKDLNQGKDLLLDIETQGAQKLKAHFPEVISIFLLPPTLKILEKRLMNRNTESEEEIKKRLTLAKEEIKHWPEYEYVIVNDKLDEAAGKLQAVILAERCRSLHFDSDNILSSELKKHLKR